MHDSGCRADFYDFHAKEGLTWLSRDASVLLLKFLSFHLIRKLLDCIGQKPPGAAS